MLRMLYGRPLRDTVWIVSIVAACAASVQCWAQSFRWNWREYQEFNWRQSLRNAPELNQSEKESIATAIANQLKVFREDTKSAESELRDEALNSRVGLIDLNQDRRPEIIVQGVGHDDCSPTGNCPFWIFQKQGKSYKLLLDGFGQTFTVQRERTNGFSDIVTSMHGSATQSDLSLFRYSNGRYHDVACYDAEWEIQGKVLDEPELTPCITPPDK